MHHAYLLPAPLLLSYVGVTECYFHSHTHTHNMISFTKSLAYKNVYFTAEMLKWERSAVEHGAGPAASELELKGLAKELSGLDCKHAVCPIHISHISKL